MSQYRSITNNTTCAMRVLVNRSGTWNVMSRRMEGGGIVVLHTVEPGEEYIVPAQEDSSQVLLELVTHYLCKVAVEPFYPVKP